MPYYRAGDYYRGDYYRGNYAAGGIFGTIGKALKKVAGTALSLTPAGKVVKLLAPVVSGAVSGLVSRRMTGPPPGLLPGFEFGPGGQFESFGTEPARGTNGGRPGHFKKDGTWTDRARPRLNPLNLKALRRANRRAHGFLKAARSAVRYYVPKAKKGKAYVAFRKRK